MTKSPKCKKEQYLRQSQMFFNENKTFSWSFFITFFHIRNQRFVLSNGPKTFKFPFAMRKSMTVASKAFESNRRPLAWDSVNPLRFVSKILARQSVSSKEDPS